MAITKVQVNTEYGKCVLEESRVVLTLPGAGENAKPICRFVHISDSHMVVSRPEDSPEIIEKVAHTRKFWNQFTDVRAELPDGSERRLDLMEVNYAVAERIRELSPDGVFITGDVVDNPSVSNYITLGEYMDSLGTKCFISLGNHDCPEEDSDDSTRAAYDSVMGKRDDVMIDTVCGIDIVSVFDGYGTVTAKETEILRKQLERGRPTVVLLHAPVKTLSVEEPARRSWGDDLSHWIVGSEGQSQECLDFVRLINENKDNILAVFSGHVHLASGGGEAEDQGESFSEDEVLQYTALPAFMGFLRVIDIVG